MQALLAGEVDMMFDTTLGVLPQIQGGRLRPLMTSSARRLHVSLYHRRYSVLNSVPSLLLQSPLMIRT